MRTTETCFSRKKQAENFFASVKLDKNIFFAREKNGQKFFFAPEKSNERRFHSLVPMRLLAYGLLLLLPFLTEHVDNHGQDEEGDGGRRDDGGQDHVVHARLTRPLTRFV